MRGVTGDLTGHALRVFRMRTLAIQYPDPWGKPAIPNKENSPVGANIDRHIMLFQTLGLCSRNETCSLLGTLYIFETVLNSKTLFYTYILKHFWNIKRVFMYICVLSQNMKFSFTTIDIIMR